MILFLDTTDKEVTKLALLSESRVVQHEWQSRYDQEETFLTSLEKFFKKTKIKISDINKIAVVPGPGLFSRVRLGVVSANALALALGIKVIEVPQKSAIVFEKINALQQKDTIHPFYDKQPNITKPK